MCRSIKQQMNYGTLPSLHNYILKKDRTRLYNYLRDRLCMRSFPTASYIFLVVFTFTYDPKYLPFANQCFRLLPNRPDVKQKTNGLTTEKQISVWLLPKQRCCTKKTHRSQNCVNFSIKLDIYTDRVISLNK